MVGSQGSTFSYLKVRLHLESNGQRHLKYEPKMAVPSHYSEWSLDFLVVANLRAVFVLLQVSSQVVVSFYGFAFTLGDNSLSVACGRLYFYGFLITL
jgi:hypothetical protein